MSKFISNGFGVNGFGTAALLSGGGVPYYQKVLALSPIAYWPLWDAVGSAAAVDLMGLGNGTPSNVTFGVTGIGDGKTAASCNGSNSLTNIYSAALASAFSGAAGTVFAWAQNDEWSGASYRRIFHFGADASNQVFISRRGGVDNLLHYSYTAGGTAKTVAIDTAGPSGFFPVAITWDINAGANGEMRVYYNGSQAFATQTALGTWSGSLAATLAVIGSSSTSPSAIWSGDLAHIWTWNRALTPTEISNLSNP